jgi:predicted CoA-binding protein
MQTIKSAAAEFLSQRRIAVTGVSRNASGHGSNLVYQRLRQRGYQVFAVNPNANTVEGDRSYPDLRSIPDGVDAVVVGTRPDRDMETVRECIALGIKRVWMHRGPGPGSVSAEAAEYGRQNGMTVIDGGCPLMFEPTADAGHKAMRMMFTMTGKVPRRV